MGCCGYFSGRRGDGDAGTPESEPNTSLANFLFLQLVNAGVPFRLIQPHSCELQVHVMQSGDPANRYPDLVIDHSRRLLQSVTDSTNVKVVNKIPRFFKNLEIWPSAPLVE